MTFQRADLFELSAKDGPFDHIFLCFVLEHLPDPVAALRHLGTLVKTGGSITAIEGDHGSFYCYPESLDAKRAVQCLVDSQARLGGDALIGRRLYPLFQSAGLQNVTVSPRMVYADASRPRWVEGFSKQTFIAMVEGVRDQALEMGLIGRSHLGQRHRRPPPRHRTRWHLLLHVLQSGGSRLSMSSHLGFIV